MDRCVTRIREAIREGDPGLEEVLARWRGHEFVVCVNGQWRLEGFILYFRFLQEVLAALDGTITPGLPPHCLDPILIARFFGLPSDAFDCPGIPVGEGRVQPARMLSITQVADFLTCSYGEARNRMLDGRIRAVKDGRWCRSRPEWVEEYLEKQTVRPESPAVEEIPVVPVRRGKTQVKVKANGVAHRFLQNRKS